MGEKNELVERLVILKEKQRLPAQSLNIEFSENDFVFTNSRKKLFA